MSHIVEISKLVEYVIHDQVFTHFNTNDLLHQNHHGSLPGHNTATALIHLYDIWLEAAEKGELTAALLLDLSAAFDLINHQIFLKKLKVYNFHESAIKLFKEYLEDRSQIVQIEKEKHSQESR